MTGIAEGCGAGEETDIALRSRREFPAEAMIRNGVAANVAVEAGRAEAVADPPEPAANAAEPAAKSCGAPDSANRTADCAAYTA